MCGFYYVSPRATALTKQIYRAGLRLGTYGLHYVNGEGYPFAYGEPHRMFPPEVQKELDYIKMKEKKLTKELYKCMTVDTNEMLRRARERDYYTPRIRVK